MENLTAVELYNQAQISYRNNDTDAYAISLIMSADHNYVKAIKCLTNNFINKISRIVVKFLKNRAYNNYLSNNGYSIYCLASLYALDKNKKYNEAMELYKLAICKNVGLAYHDLGALYYNGLGVDRDYVKAIEIYQKAMDMGIGCGFNSMGIMYRDGLGLKKNYVKAIELFEIAASLKCYNAYINLAQMYIDGRDLPQNYVKAKDFLERAIKKNIPLGYFNLGVMYHNGWGMKKDYNEAKKMYEKSINMNCNNAYLNLGVMYAQGLGVKIDFDKAEEFYKKGMDTYQVASLNNLINLYMRLYYRDKQEHVIESLRKLDKLEYLESIYRYDKYTIQLIKKNFELEAKNTKLEKEVRDLNIHIQSMPDGALYLEAKKEWDTMVK